MQERRVPSEQKRLSPGTPDAREAGAVRAGEAFPGTPDAREAGAVRAGEAFPGTPDAREAGAVRADTFCGRSKSRQGSAVEV